MSANIVPEVQHGSLCVSDATISRMCDIATKVCEDALQSLSLQAFEGQHWKTVEKHFVACFRIAIKKNTDRLLLAASVTEQQVDRFAMFESAEKEIKEHKEEKRKKIYFDLIKSKKRLSNQKKKITLLNAEIRELERKKDMLSSMVSAFSYFCENEEGGLKLKSVPDPTIHPTAQGDGLPCAPGIYFVWDSGRVAYVGQSLNLNKRARIFHKNITDEDMISFLEYPAKTLDYVESFYIGALIPSRNFGLNNKMKNIAD